MTRQEYETKTLEELCQQLEQEGDVFSLEGLKGLAMQKISDNDFNVASHLCEAMWNDLADYYLYDWSMGTLETPTGIHEKEDIEHLIEED